MQQRTDAAAVANCNSQGASDCAVFTHSGLTVLNTGPGMTQVGEADQSCVVVMDSETYRTYRQGFSYVYGVGTTIDDATSMAKGQATPDSPVRGSHCIKARP